MSPHTPTPNRHPQINPGLLYPLKSGFAFVEKPPLYLPYSDWDGLELGRSGGQGQTFDLKLGSSSGPGVEVSMIPRDEMDALKNYVAGRRAGERLVWAGLGGWAGWGWEMFLPVRCVGASAWECWGG